MQDNASLRAEQQRKGPNPDFPETFEAQTIETDVMSPVEAVEKLAIGSRPTFWFTQNAKSVVVDNDVFGTLTAVDATRLDKGVTKRIGEVRAELPDRAAKWQLVELLIRAGVIQTYIHVSSSLCVRSEKTTGGTYAVEIDGIHRYYTNEENIDPLAFAVSLDPDNEITITGRQ